MAIAFRGQFYFAAEGHSYFAREGQHRLPSGVKRARLFQAGIEQAFRYAVILMDYADETKQDYDEILIERNRSGGYWLHFAVRPKDNRRKTSFILKT